MVFPLIGRLSIVGLNGKDKSRCVIRSTRLIRKLDQPVRCIIRGAPEQGRKNLGFPDGAPQTIRTEQESITCLHRV